MVSLPLFLLALVAVEVYIATLLSRWPASCHSPLTLMQLAQYVLPIMHGFWSIHSGCTVSGVSVDFALVSRRSVWRAGTRFFRRGVDAQGYAANFVETEQVAAVTEIVCGLQGCRS